MSQPEEPGDVIGYPGEKNPPASGEVTNQDAFPDKPAPEKTEEKDEEPKPKPPAVCSGDRRPPNRQPSLPSDCKDSAPEEATGLTADEFRRLDSLMWRLQQGKKNSGGVEKKPAVWCKGL